MINRFDKKPDEPGEDWLGTFADMVSLLLAFFIMLAAISKVDPAKYEQISSGLVKELGNREIAKPLENLQIDVADTLVRMKIDDVAGVRQDEQGLVIEFPAALFFRAASAELNEGARPVLMGVAKIIRAETYKNFQVEVQGHTDDMPVSTVQFPSNWELSGARAAAAVRLLIEAAQTMEPHRFNAVGMADTRPRVPNRDPNGRAIPINQEINRRLEIRLFPR